MAKAKATTTGVSVKDILSNLKAASGNKYATNIGDEGTIGDITSYTDTGCYIWNMQVSGSLFNGLPNGQGLVVAGTSTTGKTFFSISIIENFLKQHDNGIVLIFDSENAINKSRLETRGLPLDRINYYPVMSLLDFKTQAVNVLDTINEQYKPGEAQFLILLDSLGNLPSTKELADAKSGSSKVDMTRSKEIRSVFRVVTVKLSRHKIPFVCTNHTYAKITDFYPTQEMGGGGGVKFGADYIFYLTKAKDKDSSGAVIGNVITSTAIKNRDALENTKVKMMLSYSKGLHPYYGLLPFAIDCPDISWVKDGTKYMIGEKKCSEKEIYKNGAKYFTQEILEKLNEYMKPLFNYGNSEEEKETFEDSDK